MGAEDTAPGTPLNEEMEKDKEYFREEKYNDAETPKKLKERGFSEDI